MNPDTALVVGMVLSVLAIPAIVSAMSDGRSPRVAAVVAVIGAGCVIFALQAKPSGYHWSDIPNVVYGELGRLLN